MSDNMSRATFYDPRFDARSPGADKACDCALCTLRRFGIIPLADAEAVPILDVIGASNAGLLRDAVEIVEAVVTLTIARAMDVFGPVTMMNQAAMAAHPELAAGVTLSFREGVRMSFDLFSAATVLQTIIEGLGRRMGEPAAADPSKPVESIKSEGELESLTRKLLGLD